MPGESFPGAPLLDELRDAAGRSWRERRKALEPHHRRAWRELGLWYAALALGQLGALALGWRAAWPVQLLAALPLALLHGFAFHAFTLFGHEAAHYHLSANRRRNDALGHWLLWAWTGQSTRGYRRFHWQHHLHLGDHHDTEVSYHQCASALFLLRLLSGAYLVEALFRYLARRGEDGQPTPSAEPGSVARFALYHGVVLLPALLAQQWLAALSWLLGLLVVFPALNSLRQLLEHRDEEARCETDFRLVTHGPMTRDFGDGLWATVVGPAGFNRHLLHHWDPTVSYTNFAEMEAFLREAGLADDLDRQRRSYGRALLHALRMAGGD